MIHDNILDTIGDTPLIRLHRISAHVPPTMLAKVERFNPGASIKDRAAKALLEDMERNGRLSPGGTVVEGSSGNMGVGLAMACAQRGYRCIVVIPDKMSRERTKMIRAFGGEVIITRTDVPPDHPESFLETARRITREIPGAVMADQFCNQANPECHYRTTAEELWRGTGGRLDAFVMGMGTGGTMSGVSRFLKERDPAIRIIGAEPEGSIIKHFFDTGREGEAWVYAVEGIGEDFIPETLHMDHVDLMHYVSDAESFYWARRICREEGMLVGGSSGTILAAGLRVAKDMREDQTMVVVFPDSGERYLSKFYDEDWMKEQGFVWEPGEEERRAVGLSD